MPDYPAIEKIVTDTASKYYHPNLLQRYLDYDRTMNDSEYYYFYYGYFFNRQRYLHGTSKKLYFEVHEITSKEEVSLEDTNKLIKIVKDFLDVNPISFESVEYLYELASGIGDTTTSVDCEIRLRQIKKTILSSGDGRSQNTGYHVVETRHEIFILSALEYSHDEGAATINYPSHYYDLAEEKDGIDRVYFDITQLQKDWIERYTLPGQRNPQQKKNKRRGLFK